MLITASQMGTLDDLSSSQLGSLDGLGASESQKGRHTAGHIPPPLHVHGCNAIDSGFEMPLSQFLSEVFSIGHRSSWMGKKMKHIINYVYIFLHNNFDMLIIHRSQSSRNPFICGNCQIHLPNASVVTIPPPMTWISPK